MIFLPKIDSSETLQAFSHRREEPVQIGKLVDIPLEISAVNLA